MVGQINRQRRLEKKEKIFRLSLPLEIDIHPLKDLIMSDFFRRASDALYHRPRQGSADSTDAPKSPDAVNQSEQDMLNHQVGLNQSGSRINDNVAGEAAGTSPHPLF